MYKETYACTSNKLRRLRKGKKKERADSRLFALKPDRSSRKVIEGKVFCVERGYDFTAGTRNRDSCDTGPGEVLTVLISQARDLVPSVTQTARLRYPYVL